MSGQLDEISRAIGGLEKQQEALTREIEAGFRRVQDQMDRMQQSYHDLNNKAQKQMGEMEVEFGNKVKSLDTRVAGLEVLNAKLRGEHRANVRWVTGVAAFVSAVIALIAELIRAWRGG